MNKKFWMKMGLTSVIVIPAVCVLGVIAEADPAAKIEAIENPPVEPRAEPKTNGVPGPYVSMDFSHLLGIEGFSDAALKLHFKLYEGYVRRSNLLLSILDEYMREGKDRTPQYSDIKRRLGWEMDGMRLHEYYFSVMDGSGNPTARSLLYKELVSQYGSYDNWKKDFEATGSMAGIGWAILYQDPKDGRLINMWVNEHDHGHLANGSLILPMDVFEHAYLLDYGLDRQGYINAFFDNLNWPLIEKRYVDAQEARAVYQADFPKVRRSRKAKKKAKKATK